MHKTNKFFFLLVITIPWSLIACVKQDIGSSPLVQQQVNATQVDTQGKKDLANDNCSDPQALRSEKDNLEAPDLDYGQPLEQEVIVTPPPASRQQADLAAVKVPPDLSSGIHFELDIKETKVMQNYYEFYSIKKKKTFLKWLQRARPYLPYIKSVFTDYGLPQDLIFLPFAESGFNTRAYSHAGAAGLWQFMPSTARLYGLKVNWWIDERRDPYLSTQAAATYLKKLYNQFNDWYLVLAAYNTGEGRIAWAMKKTGKTDYFDLVKYRRYLYKETKNYVPKFLAILKIVKNLDELNFPPLKINKQAEPSYLEIPGGTDLYSLAKYVGLSWKKFRELNPAFRRLGSPPGFKSRVYMPAPKISFAKAFLKRPEARPFAGYLRYRIKRGESWWSIARKFSIPIAVLKRVNNTRRNLLHPGQHILIPGHKSYMAHSKKFAVPNLSGTYLVQKNDNLWSIAHRFGLTTHDLRKANQIWEKKPLLQPGKRLIIPIANSENKAQRRIIARKRANYIVQQGDSLWGISKRFGLSISTLVTANGFSDYQTQLKIGQKIYIPDLSRLRYRMAKEEASQAHARIITYQVQKGDSLWTIAKRFGISTEQLIAWNEIKNKEKIFPGESLKILLQQ